MQPNRIYFAGNPWPEGHPVKEFQWSARLINGEVWFDLHLKSADYYSERGIDSSMEDADAEGMEYASDWEAPIVWENYHACTLSSTYWQSRGFKACSRKEYCPEFFDGREFSVDPAPEQAEDWDDLAFHIYLLGHDSAAKHRITFEKAAGAGLFNIRWTGKIAPAYTDNYEYTHDFSVYLENVEFPALADAGCQD